MKRTRWRLVVACLAVTGAAIAVAAGGAGNREGTGTLVPQPGPGAVTYGENIAYKATFSNDGGSMFTQTKYVMAPPVTSGAEKATPVASSCGTFDSSDVLTCNFGQLPPGAKAELTVVWKTPSGATKPGCKVDLAANPIVECLKAEGKWLIKEGKTTNGNETFPVSALASLIGVSSNDPVNSSQRAGGFELVGCNKDNPSSLATNQAINATTNPVTTSYCLPATFTAGAAEGVASTISEPASDSVNFAHQSEVCIAKPQTNCGDSTYVARGAMVTAVNAIDPAAARALLQNALQDKDWAVRVRADMLFREQGIQLLVSGHYHRNAIATDGDLTNVTTGPVGKPQGDNPQSGLRAFVVNGSGISHRFYPLSDLPNQIDPTKPLSPGWMAS